MESVYVVRTSFYQSFPIKMSSVSPFPSLRMESKYLSGLDPTGGGRGRYGFPPPTLSNLIGTGHRPSGPIHRGKGPRPQKGFVRWRVSSPTVE